MEEKEIKSHTIIAQDAEYLKDTILLLNGMVVTGAKHSERSLQVAREAMSILNNL